MLAKVSASATKEVGQTEFKTNPKAIAHIKIKNVLMTENRIETD